MLQQTRWNFDLVHCVLSDSPCTFTIGNNCSVLFLIRNNSHCQKRHNTASSKGHCLLKMLWRHTRTVGRVSVLHYLVSKKRHCHTQATRCWKNTYFLEQQEKILHTICLLRGVKGISHDRTWVTSSAKRGNRLPWFFSLNKLLFSHRAHNHHGNFSDI